MIAHRLRSWMIAFMAVLIGGQVLAISNTNDVLLATVAGAPIYQSEFERYIEGGWAVANPSQVRTNPSARNDALQGFLDLKIMAAKAHKDGLDKQETFKKASELMEMKLLVQTLTQRDQSKLTNTTKFTDQELQNFYDQHPDLFAVTPTFTFRQILVYVKGNSSFPDQGLEETAAKARAAKALDKLRNGASWDTVAREFSDDPIGSHRGGLITDAQFGYFPTEVEAAIRQQKLGTPGELVKSHLGYHVLQIEQRTPEGQRDSLEKVKPVVSALLAQDQPSHARSAYIAVLRAEVGLQKSALATNDAPLQLSRPGDQDRELAAIGVVSIRESDFEWFLKDAFRPEQRTYVLNQPGARKQLLNTYLDMRVLAAKALKDGLDQQPPFKNARAIMEMKLLAEFLQERDRMTPWMLPGSTEAEREVAFRKYLDRIRSEMDLEFAPTSSSSK